MRLRSNGGQGVENETQDHLRSVSSDPPRFNKIAAQAYHIEDTIICKHRR
jgi:hypothetical protein